MPATLRIGQKGGVPLFSNNTGVTQNNKPAVISGTGTFDSGLQMADAIGHYKWAFQVIGSPNAGTFQATIYGTIDPAAYDLWMTGAYPAPPSGLDTGGSPFGNISTPGIGQGSTQLPATSWFVLPAQSEQGTFGLAANPITSTSIVLPYQLSGLVAIRCVIVTTGVTSGTLQVLAFAGQ